MQQSIVACDSLSPQTRIYVARDEKKFDGDRARMGTVAWKVLRTLARESSMDFFQSKHSKVAVRFAPALVVQPPRSCDMKNLRVDGDI